MPTARMGRDGLFTATISQQDTLDVYALTYQALPWVETTFRYSVFNPGGRLGSRDDLRDRSYEVKARLLRERAYLPAVAVGVRDILGTGVLGAEYVVASKQIGPVDLSVGLGWGRLSDRSVGSNPLGVLDDRFDTRNANIGQGGRPSFGTFFRGQDVGLFGGFSWDTGFRDIHLIAEYGTDRYVRERNFGTLFETDPWSYGIQWKPLPDLDLTFSRQIGNDFAVRISAALDTNGVLPRKPRRPFWGSGEAPTRSQPPPGVALDNWYSRLLFDVERSGAQLRSATLTDDGRVAWLEIGNTRYALVADAIERVLSFAEVHLPRRVRTVNVVVVESGITEATVSYRRQLGGDGPTGGALGLRAIDVLPPHLVGDADTITRYPVPRMDYTVSFGTRLQVMDPDDPLRYQVYARLGVDGELPHGVRVRGSVILDLYNDFDDIERASNSVLPRVRSDVREYLQQGDTGIDALYLEKRGNFAPEVQYRGYAGILEEQYSGAGIEVLWRPFGSRFAFGGTVNSLHQRDFDKDFGLRDFETVTAFASAYWATPVANFDMAIHAGRYLARDVGATFEIRRTFDNGFQIGAWATLTDVPFDDFGEGSFDKGLFFRVPFNNLLPGDSRGNYTVALRSIQRDGGQRTESFGSTLWWDSRDTRTDALVRTRDRMLPQ